MLTDIILAVIALAVWTAVAWWLALALGQAIHGRDDADLAALVDATCEPRHHTHERLADTGEMAAVPDELARRRARGPA
jgi:hypothetical protein